MEVSERRDCGYPGISAKECAARKCCFSDLIPEVPWCFFPRPVQGKVVGASPHLAPRHRGFPGGGAPEPRGVDHCRKQVYWWVSLAVL